MTPLESAVVEAASVFDSLSIPHALIGGLAVAVWGEPRATLDADWLVWVPAEALEPAIASLGEQLQLMTSDPLAFVRQTRVLPAKSSRQVRCDIVFGTLPWEKRAIARAQPKQVAGRQVPVAAIEDLILMKLISEREQDRGDARRLLRRFAARLEWASIESQSRELATALGRDDFLQTLKEACRS
jgi:hypothetical protein